MSICGLRSGHGFWVACDVLVVILLAAGAWAGSDAVRLTYDETRDLETRIKALQKQAKPLEYARKWADVHALYQETRGQYPDDAYFQVWLLEQEYRVLEKEGRLDEALDGHTSLLSVDTSPARCPLLPIPSSLWVRIGDCHRKMGEFAEADKAYREALQVRPIDGPHWPISVDAPMSAIWAMVSLRDKKYVSGDPEECLRRFTAELAPGELHRRALEARARFYLSHKELDKAEKAYRETERCYPEHWDTRYIPVDLAYQFARAGMGEKAKAEYRHAIEVYQDLISEQPAASNNQREVDELRRCLRFAEGRLVELEENGLPADWGEMSFLTSSEWVLGRPHNVASDVVGVEVTPFNAPEPPAPYLALWGFLQLVEDVSIAAMYETMSQGYLERRGFVDVEHYRDAWLPKFRSVMVQPQVSALRDMREQVKTSAASLPPDATTFTVNLPANPDSRIQAAAIVLVREGDEWKLDRWGDL